MDTDGLIGGAMLRGIHCRIVWLATEQDFIMLLT